MIDDKIKINIFSDEECLQAFNQQLEFFNTKKEDLTKMCFFFKNFSYYLDERLSSIDKLIRLIPKEGSATYFGLINLFKDYFVKERTLILQTNNMIKVDIIEKYDSKTNKMNDKVKFLINRINKKNEEHQKIIDHLHVAQDEFIQKAGESTIQYQKLLEAEGNPKSSTSQKEKQRKKSKALQDDLDKKILDYKTSLKESENSRVDYINIKQENINEFKNISSDAIITMQSNILFFISQLLSNNSSLRESLDKIIQSGDKMVNMEKDLSYLEEKRKTVQDFPKKCEFMKFNKEIEFTDDIKNNNKINKDEIKTKLIAYMESINNNNSG